MEVLKYCRVCLVTDVRMYSLDITSNDSIGLIYSHLAQIRICDRNQHVCFECAYLLHKYHKFKSKCLRAHNILSSITVNSTEITKQIIENIDRKENRLESNLILSDTSIYSESSNDLIDEDCDKTLIKVNEHDKTQIEVLQIKTEEITTETNDSNNEIDNKDTSENIDETISNELIQESAIKTVPIKSKIKEPKTKKRNVKNEVQVSETDDKCESPDVFNDNDFIDSSEEITPVETSVPKRKTRRKEPKTKRRKVKTVINSEDNLSDDEPLSKCATKITDKKIKEPLVKKNGLNIEFFDDYATVTFLTPDDAKKELLSRKESSNYKRSPYKCNFCYKGYEAKAAFENHMKKHSKEYGDYECDLCHLRFPKHIYLCKHKLSCHKRKFSCKLCPYICYCMYQARTHVSLHKGKKYPCKDCGEIFSMPNSLLMHKRVKHLDESVPESVCELCGNTFGSPRGLFLHNMKLHRTDKNSKQGPKCEECGVHFASEVAWKRHLVLSSKHTVSNGCKYCGERFTNIEELKSHKRTHHPRIKPKKYDKKLPAACAIEPKLHSESWSPFSRCNFPNITKRKCKDQCNKWLSSHVEYNNHISTEHPLSEEARKLSADDLTPFVCEVCGQTFKQQCFLTYHQRKHTGERPYACAECGKTFVMAGALSIHRTVHSRKRNYKCHLCQRVFSFKSALNKHIKVHLGIRPHKCTICDKGFIHMCDLKLHIKYVHDKVPWPKKKSKRNVDDNNTYLEYNGG